MKKRTLLGFAAIALVAAACSGRESQTLPATSLHPMVVVTTGPNQYIEVTGTISGVTSTFFTLYSGAGTGYVHVYTTSSTMFSGAAPYAGESVDVKGTGSTSTSITASSVAQIGATPTPSPTPTPAPGSISAPSGVLTLTGPITSVWSGGFTTQSSQDGYMHVYVNSSPLIAGGSIATSKYALSTGPGTGSTYETASIVGVFASPPPTIAATGSIVQSTAYGFTLDVDSTHTAVPVALSSATTFPDGPVQTGETVTVSGPGSLSVEIAAQGVAAGTAPPPTPVPTATPGPNATPTPIDLYEGMTNGLDDQFSPADGDSASGGNGQTVVTANDGSLPCLSSMFDSGYHVHAFVGILVNGTEIAQPDGAGMDQPRGDTNGITNYATCFYEMHTHDASGLVHIETGSTTTPMSASVYTLGDWLQLWGESLTSTSFGPYSGMTRVFYAQVPLTTTVAQNYQEWTSGDPNSLPLYSHEAIWIEVGPTYVVPPHIPPIHFYSTY